MAQPYAAYPPQGGYYPPEYSYSAGYYGYDPNQAYWQQQQAYPQYGAAAAAGQPPQQQQQQAVPGPSPPQAPPPLPADEPPPPLPPEDSADAPQPTSQGVATAAGAASAQEAATAAAANAPPSQQQQQQQPQATQQQATQADPTAAAPASAHSYAQYPYYDYAAQGYASYYGYGAAPPPYGPPGYGAAGYGYPPAYGPYDPSATNASYAAQVQQQPHAPCPPPGAPPAGAGSAGPQAPPGNPPPAAGAGPNAPPASTPPSRASRWGRAPAVLASSTGGKPSAIRPAGIVVTGSNAVAVGSGGSDAASKVAAAVAAANQAAARLTSAGNSSMYSPHQQQQQQQFIAVGGGSAQTAGTAAKGGAVGDLPKPFIDYLTRSLNRYSGEPADKKAQLREMFVEIIKQHRTAGTLWAVDWDRQPLVVLPGATTSPPAAAAGAAAGGFGVSGAGGSSSGYGARNSVFERMSSPRGGQQQGRDSRGNWQWGKGGGGSSRYRDYSHSDEEGGDSRGEYDYSRGGNYSRGSSRSRHKRGWDDSSRYGSSDDSDDERSDSYDRDNDSQYSGAAGGWGRGGGNKKKQRLQLHSPQGGGRGKGRGRKQQQEGGRGRGKGRGGRGGRGNNAGQHGGLLDAADAARNAARAARFAEDPHALQRAAYGWDDEGSSGDGGFVVGTCQKLEKRYLRLTKAPAPEEVRPQPVLAAALQRLLGMIVAKADKYLYFNDQFKAMRQDLTVQGIKNDFTVQVYEAHARAALEYGDTSEYNQCQTQLAILYAKGLPGSHAEFGAYRLLYQAVYAQQGEGSKLMGTLRQLLGNKVGQVAEAPEVQHAMQVRQALATGNVLRFFQLYRSAPLLGRRIMDAAVKQLRFRTLSALARTHKPTALSLAFLSRVLGFAPPQDQQQQPQQQPQQQGVEPMQQDQPQQQQGAGLSQLPEQQQGAPTVDAAGALLPGCCELRCVGENEACADAQQGLQACLEWCTRHGAVFDQQTDLSSAVLVTKECWNKLFVPVDTTKVAHGDANLDIRDFLASALL